MQGARAWIGEKGTGDKGNGNWTGKVSRYKGPETKDKDNRRYETWKWEKDKRQWKGDGKFQIISKK